MKMKKIKFLGIIVNCLVFCVFVSQSVKARKIDPRWNMPIVNSAKQGDLEAVKSHVEKSGPFGVKLTRVR